MARIATFEDLPQAEQAATMLREQGFHAVVIARGSQSYEETIGRFFQGKTHGFNESTLVISDDAEAQPFDTAVTRQYGRVITGTTE